MEKFIETIDGMDAESINEKYVLPLVENYVAMKEENIYLESKLIICKDLLLEAKEEIIKLRALV